MHGDFVMDHNKVVELEDRYYSSGYQKLPVAIVKGKGSIVWDIEGKEYIDCMSGYGVAILGHCNPFVVEAIKRQAERLITCHCSLYNDVRAELLEKMMKLVPKGLEKVFLSSSGAEAVETALKLARRHTGKHEVIAMMGSFHGKTFGALSATWSQKYRGPFEPLLPGFKFVPFGDLNKVKEKVSDKTAAIIVEPIQGEGGVHLPPDGFLQGLRELCDKRGILLIFDEIQCGFGRTGKLWACEHWGVIPDVLCAGKGFAGGIPIGVTFSKDEVMSSLKVGEHSSTFGGNPIACAASLAALEYLVKNDLIRRAAKVGTIFKSGLVDIQRRYKVVRDVRGLGLMLALELRFDIKDVLLNGIKEGLLMLYSGRNIVRLLPPLIINEQEVKKAVDILSKVIAIEEENKLRPRL